MIILRSYGRARGCFHLSILYYQQPEYGCPLLPSLSNILPTKFFTLPEFLNDYACAWCRLSATAGTIARPITSKTIDAINIVEFSIHLFIHLFKSSAGSAIACSTSVAATSIENLTNQVLTNHLSTSIDNKTRDENSEGIDRGRNDYCNTNTCGA